MVPRTALLLHHLLGWCDGWRADMTIIMPFLVATTIIEEMERLKICDSEYTFS
jgi:hypothetical protein